MGEIHKGGYLVNLMAFSILLVGISLLPIYRILKGPTSYDRLISLNILMLVLSVIFIGVSIAEGIGHFLDIAVVFIVLNFIATMSFAKYLEGGDFV